MAQYSLTENEKNILRLVAEGLRDGTIELTWIPHPGRGGLAMLTGVNLKLVEEIKENRLQFPQLNKFVQDGFLIRDGEKYTLDEQTILDAVDNDFSEPSSFSSANCQHKIFISYSHKDNEIARDIARLLIVAYEFVWYDRGTTERLSGGQDWKQKIQGEISRCDVFMFLMSPDAFKSPPCREELEQAKREKKFILPVLIHECTPPNDLTWVLNTHYCDMREGITIATLNTLYADLIRAMPGDKYILTSETKEWARKLVKFWEEGKIDQSFGLIEYPVMNQPQWQTQLMRGILDDELRKNGPFPPVAVFVELQRYELIGMLPQYTNNGNSWNIILREDLKQAVRSNFK